MADAPVYCSHIQLKRVFPQLDEYDSKQPIYGWVVDSGSLYVAKDSGRVDQLFADGRDLGAAQASSGACGTNGKWFYDSDNDEVFYFNNAANPIDLLMESGEEFTGLVTQFREDASRYLDSRLDPKLPKSQWKNSKGEFDYIIIRTTALIAAAFMIRTHNPTNEALESIELEYEKNIELLNTGKASLGFQNTGDASMGVIRDVTYTAGKLRPVDLKGNARGVDFDLIQVKVTTTGVLGTGTYSVWVKDSDKLKSYKHIEDEKITGDYQLLAYGLRIRFGGESDSDQAAINDEWEIEVRGVNEAIDASDMTGIKMTRRRGF